MSASPKPLPRALAFLASSAVTVHLLAVVLLTLSAPSGPWPTPFGPSTATGPAFAVPSGNALTRRYLAPIKMTHNYHFARNRPAQPGAFFEVRLKDGAGRVVETLRFPDEKANFWVRHRQSILAQNLADDQLVAAPAGEAIPAPNRKVSLVEIWEPDSEGALHLRAVPEHLVPRDRSVFHPSEWSLCLSRSYCRHLCREHGAASAELVRHTREAVLPAILFADDPPADTFQELLTYFPEVKK